MRDRRSLPLFVVATCCNLHFIVSYVPHFQNMQIKLVVCWHCCQIHCTPQINTKSDANMWHETASEMIFVLFRSVGTKITVYLPKPDPRTFVLMELPMTVAIVAAKFWWTSSPIFVMQMLEWQSLQWCYVHQTGKWWKKASSADICDQDGHLMNMWLC